ncbi:hypothetical protein AQPE_3054 [Aquipluma nitroreducens]|uniref:BioF2-like acetyltransferase domain-containing protein n=1 Tax=Aquipluma nitroreducens TaxID=2010828 RepID=A0A5K7SC48_9BACT|nr:hypothetical protein [Aquipluma nitroreducens]BBE18884.1 hypothetical protein AQPE_3054 [Aquipluma nitroreducens]
MVKEDIIDIYINAGFNIKKVNNSHFLRKDFILYSFPTLMDFKLDKILINKLKWKSIITNIKINSKIKNTNEYILNVTNYSIETFSSKTRNQIRKSLKECIFKRPSLNDLIEYGLKINQQTLERQKRKEEHLINYRFWPNYISTFYNNPNVIVLGAYIEESMIGYIICYEIDTKYTILHPFFDKGYSSSNPMLGLIYTLVNLILEKENSILLSYGIESFEANSSLDRFKRSLQFVPIPATRVYIIHPLILFSLKILVFFIIKFGSSRTKRKKKVQKIINLYQGYRIIKKTIR